MKSPTSSVSSPSLVMKRTFGRSEVTSSRLVALASKWTCPPRTQPQRDQILQDLVLGVDRNDAAVGAIVQVDAVAAAIKAQLEAVVHETLAFHALAGADLGHQVDGGLLQHAGA